LPRAAGRAPHLVLVKSLDDVDVGVDALVHVEAIAPLASGFGFTQLML
jgi:hypothetical protein